MSSGLSGAAVFIPSLVSFAPGHVIQVDISCCNGACVHPESFVGCVVLEVLEANVLSKREAVRGIGRNMTRSDRLCRDEFNAHLVESMQSLYNLALWLCRDEHQASDLVQEAVLKAIRARKSFQTGTNFKAWMFRILKNCFFNLLKKQGREEILDFEGGMLNGSGELRGDSQRGLLPFLMRADIDRALGKLPESWRFLVLLVDMEGFALDEAAGVLGIPVGTVKSRLFRARVILSRYLSAYRSGE